MKRIMTSALVALLLTTLATPQQGLKLDCLDSCHAYNTSTNWGQGWNLTIMTITHGEGREECTATCKQCQLQYVYSYTGTAPWYVENGQGSAQGSGNLSGSGGLRADCSESAYWFAESGPRPNPTGGVSVLLNCSCL